MMKPSLLRVLEGWAIEIMKLNPIDCGVSATILPSSLLKRLVLLGAVSEWQSCRGDSYPLALRKMWRDSTDPFITILPSFPLPLLLTLYYLSTTNSSPQKYWGFLFKAVSPWHCTPLSIFYVCVLHTCPTITYKIMKGHHFRKTVVSHSLCCLDWNQRQGTSLFVWYLFPPGRILGINKNMLTGMIWNSLQVTSIRGLSVDQCLASQEWCIDTTCVLVVTWECAGTLRMWITFPLEWGKRPWKCII